MQKILHQRNITDAIRDCAEKYTFQNNKDKYNFIAKYKECYPIQQMCRVLKVSSSCYYRWLHFVPTDTRKVDNQFYTPIIKAIFDNSKQTYGSHRIRAVLEQMGYPMSRKRVGRIMVANGWESKHKRKRKFKITKEEVLFANTAKNLLQQNFTTTGLNQVWVSDLTYIDTQEGWLYLTTILDLYNREIIGYAFSQVKAAEQSTIPALNMALSKRGAIENPLIFHSDRGIEYSCHAFRNALNEVGLITQSMSRTGNCWDNAVAESFFKTLKTEIGSSIYASYSETIHIITDYINNWYNTKRIHSSLAYLSPRNYANS